MRFICVVLAAFAFTSPAHAQTFTVRGQDPILANAQQDHKLDLLESLTNRLIEAIDELAPRLGEAQTLGASNARRVTATASDLDSLRSTIQSIRGEIGAAKALNDRLNATINQCVQERDGYYRAYAGCASNPPCPAVSCPQQSGGR